jgi:pimeloyl-ACP methyl ester carboxylesterase
MKKRWRLVALLIAVVVIGAGGYWFGAIPAAVVPDGQESQAWFAPGPFAIISESFTAIDESRPTQAYRDFAGLPVRELRGEIWRPARAAQAGPLLVYSHGFMSFHREGLYLARFLASHGYTVVAVDYPLSGYRAPDGPFMRDVVNQPADVSFLIDTMLKRNADPNDALFATIDPRKIAVAGTSLGGLTATLVTFHRQMRDPRIAAAISIAGPTSMFSADFFADSHVPFMLIFGDGDVIVPYAANATPILEKYANSTLVSLHNASHAGFAQPAATLMRFIANPDGVGCRAVLQGLGDDLAKQNGQFAAILGGAGDGILTDTRIDICASPPIPVAMQAARQHMFTTLSSYAFLESLFATDGESRDAARRYLQQTLPAENNAEVAVAQHYTGGTTQ